MLIAALAITAKAVSGGGGGGVSGGSPFVSKSTGHFVAGQPVDGVGCGPTEGQTTHIHQHLDVIVDGKTLTPPPYIGFVPSKGCLYWIHRHNDYPGVIHLEAPIRQTYRLGAFLDIWSVTPDTVTFQGGQSFHIDKSLLHIIESRQPSVVAVDGQPYTGDIRQIFLYPHTIITLGYGVKSVTQQPFDFSQVDGAAAMPTVPGQ